MTNTQQKNYSNTLTVHNIQIIKSNSIPPYNKNSTRYLTGTTIRSTSKQELTHSIVNEKINTEETKQTER